MEWRSMRTLILDSFEDSPIFNMGAPPVVGFPLSSGPLYCLP